MLLKAKYKGREDEEGVSSYWITYENERIL